MFIPFTGRPEKPASNSTTQTCITVYNKVH